MGKKKIKEKTPMAITKRKTEYRIPTFSFKGAIIIMLFAITGTLIVPMLLNFLGLNFKVGVVLGNAFLTSYGIAYVRYFIESKEGYCKNFYILYGGFAIAFAIISIFWLFLNIYI